MKYYKVKNLTRQAGMTLIELSVVLLILVGLAGLLIPYVSGFVAKTHDATTTSTIAELNNTIQRFQTQRQAFPDRLESLYDVASGTIYNKLMTTAYLGTSAANASMVSSLNKAGITTVLNANNLTGAPTFASTTGAAFTVASGTNLVVMKGNPAAQFWGDTTQLQLIYAFGGQSTDYDTTCHSYVVLGIGDGNEMVGNAMQAAPVHFSENGDNGPTLKYGRYVAVFKVQNTTASPGTAVCPDQPQAAKFVGAAMDLDFAALVGQVGSLSWTNSRLNTN